MKDNPEDEKPKAVVRPYTPTSPPSARGYLDLVIKGATIVATRVA